MKRIFLLAAVSAVCFLSCKKNISDSTVPHVGINKYNSTPVTGSVAGMITNENDEPVANAQVVISGNTFTTNSNGVYKTAAITLDKYISTVKVTVPGYFTAYRSFSATANRNFVDIKLIPKTTVGTFNAGSGGTVSLANGSNISFQANSIKVKSSGAAYPGTVTVYAAYVDPTSADIALKIPGGNIGEDADKLYVMKMMGSMAVELESGSGEALQLIADKPASIKSFIPATLQSNAPEAIDTWSLDERGVWMKEATASKSGNFYNMDVSHFSYWSSNVPLTPVFLTMNFKDQLNRPLIRSYISILGDLIPGTLSYYYGGGYTDELGTLTGMVPANEILKYYTGVYGSGCATNRLEGNIGPYTADATENFVFNIDPSQAMHITGTAVDCSGNPIVNGEAEIYLQFSNMGTMGAFYIVNITNGTFDVFSPICIQPISFYVIAVDNNAMLQSATMQYPFSNELNTGPINVCGLSTNQYINFTLDGTNYVASSSSATAAFNAYTPNWGGSPFTLISGGDNIAGAYLSLKIRANSTGIFTVPPVDSIRVNNYWSLNLDGASATISTFPPVGQYYEGSFDVPFVDGGVNHTLTGTYRVKRDY